jgi:hypothetical protein
MSESTSILHEILAKITSSVASSLPIQACISSVFSLSNGLERNPVSVNEFQAFLSYIHDLLIKLDSSRRCCLLRTIRFCLQSSDHVKVFISDEITWIVTTALEQDNENNTAERVQALKLIEKIRKIAPDHFPIGFGRSLVAIANTKDDSLRKLSLDSLRELAMVNPSVVAIVHGFATLMEAVIDPLSEDSAQNILCAILFLLNEPISR